MTTLIECHQASADINQIENLWPIIKKKVLMRMENNIKTKISGNQSKFEC